MGPGLTARRLDLVHHRLSGVGGTGVVHHQGGTGGGQLPGDRGANAPAGAGDQGDLAGKGEGDGHRRWVERIGGA